MRGEGQQGNRESHVQHMATANRPANGKCWPQFQESELMFELMFPPQGNMGMGAPPGPSLLWGCGRSQAAHLDPGDWEWCCIPSTKVSTKSGAPRNAQPRGPPHGQGRSSFFSFLSFSETIRRAGKIKFPGFKPHSVTDRCFQKLPRGLFTASSTELPL